MAMEKSSFWNVSDYYCNFLRNNIIVSVGKVVDFWRFFGIWGGTKHPTTLVIETFFKFEGQGYKLVQTRKKSIHWFRS